VKLIGVRQVQAELGELLARSQKERVLITRHGKPVALVTGVEKLDLEDIVLLQDRDFWELIEERRQSKRPTVSHEQLRAKARRDLAKERRRTGKTVVGRGGSASRRAGSGRVRTSARVASK
jgi:prevent-host-death family protein